jgi:hypothetical protein
MIKRLKHGTTVMRETLRKREGPLALREDFQQAADHFKSIQQTISAFIDDAQSILKALPALSKQASALSACAVDALNSFPDGDRAVSVQGAVLAHHLADFTAAQVQEATDTILRPLRDLHTQISDLAAVHAEQRSSFLILESNKSKLELFQKDAEKNALKIEEYTEKVTTRTAIVEGLEEEFIGRMEAIWENRFEVLNRPLVALVELVMGVGRLVRGDVETLAAILGPDIVDADYPAAVPPEKGKK